MTGPNLEYRPVTRDDLVPGQCILMTDANRNNFDITLHRNPVRDHNNTQHVFYRFASGVPADLCSVPLTDVVGETADAVFPLSYTILKV